MTAVAERNLLKNEKPIDPGDTSQKDLQALLKDTQGNILKPHGRDHVKHLFVRFNKDTIPAARNWLATMAEVWVTSALKQWQDSSRRSEEMAAAKSISDPEARAEAIAEVRLRSKVFVNLLLSSKGYDALRLKKLMPRDKSFELGSRHQDVLWKLNDPPPDQWDKGFNQELHALIIVADDNDGPLTKAVDRIKKSLQGVGAVVHEETGNAMRLDHDGKTRPDGPVREHFGYLDGLSDPLFYAKDLKKVEEKEGARDRYSDPFAQLGLVLLPDPGAKEGGCGSYFVYRKLRQHVAKFKHDQEELAKKLEAAAEGTTQSHEYYKDLAGAYVFGRFTDGTPVVRQSKPSGKSVGELVNKFDYGKDRDGTMCPLSSHIRKTNPRGDAVHINKSDLEYERSRRIARRGMSYGPQTLNPGENEDVGMLFLCAQSSIVEQFEFMRHIWSDQKDFPLVDTGMDPLIGHSADLKIHFQKWPSKYGGNDKSKYLDNVSVGPWVTLRGAEYFFVPSLSFLRSGRRS